MSLRLDMHGPTRVHPGQVVRYELELVGDAPANSVELTVRSSRGTSLPKRIRQEIRRDLAVARYRGDSDRRFPIDIVIPQQPSHVVEKVAWAGLWIEAVVSAQGALIQRHFPIHVCEPLDGRGPVPIVERTRTFVELAIGLGATRATGGTMLVGECSITNLVADARVVLEVICVVHEASGFGYTVPVHTQTLRVPKHAAATGVPFTIPLPGYLAPSLALDTHRLQYHLRATHRHWLKVTTVSIPLEIVDARPAPARIRPPHVGERDVEPVFVEVAARAGWRVGPSVDAHPELGTISPWIYAAHAGLVMRLGYAFRDDGSTFLISRIRYQPLELGFEVTPGKRGGALVANVPDWDRAHAVAARDHVRATAILTSVVPALGPLGSLVRWDDDWLVCERAVAEIDAALVAEVANALRTVCGKLAKAIRADELDVGPYR